jgi:hypothetical protein
MLVAMTVMAISLMQFVRVMQDPLMIPLPSTRMNRSMPLNPRITLPTPRHLMRVPRMIGRLSHVLPRRRSMRRHTTLRWPSTTIKIHLPRLVKTTLIVRHDMRSL